MRIFEYWIIKEKLDDGLRPTKTAKTDGIRLGILTFFLFFFLFSYFFSPISGGCSIYALWVGSSWKLRIQFIDKTTFPFKLRSEWASERLSAEEYLSKVSSKEQANECSKRARERGAQRLRPEDRPIKPTVSCSIYGVAWGFHDAVLIRLRGNQLLFLFPTLFRRWESQR